MRTLEHIELEGGHPLLGSLFIKYCSFQYMVWRHGMTMLLVRDVWALSEKGYLITDGHLFSNIVNNIGDFFPTVFYGQNSVPPFTIWVKILREPCLGHEFGPDVKLGEQVVHGQEADPGGKALLRTRILLFTGLNAESSQFNRWLRSKRWDYAAKTGMRIRFWPKTGYRALYLKRREIFKSLIIEYFR